MDFIARMKKGAFGGSQQDENAARSETIEKETVDQAEANAEETDSDHGLIIKVIKL